jgi:hypothetical protein
MKLRTIVLGEGNAATDFSVASIAGRVRYCVTPSQEKKADLDASTPAS